jgi:eukaryotic-like serine/threonine-protein kinase
MLDLTGARALLALAVAPPNAEPSFQSGMQFSDYELGEVIGRGAQAVVFRAYEAGAKRRVALKVMLGGDLATEEELRRFRFGAEAAANLDHPHIVKVLHVGEHNGHPFFSMQLHEGGDLRGALDVLRQSPEAAAELMTKIANAVHHAHQRGVLHRDLKPANIVLDVLDDRVEPYVADFGLAKALDRVATLSNSREGCGAPCYVAPEQALGPSRDLTVAADVFSLGVILYELLTGTVPINGATVGEVFAKMGRREPIRSPRLHDSRIDRGLSSICMKCLEYEPEARYHSAEELALDLERWVDKKPISVYRAGVLVRTAHWCRRHPVAATALAGALMVFTATAVVGWSVARSQQQALRQEVLEVNRYAAQATAAQVLFELRDLSDPIARCAADLRVIDHFRQPEATRQPAGMQPLLRECGATTVFETVNFVDRQGVAFARAPEPLREYLGKNFGFRDYFAGAKRLGERGQRGVYAGRAYWSEADDKFKISLSAPVLDSDDRWLGVISVTIFTDVSLGSLRSRESGRQMAVLAGLRDRNRGETALPADYMVLVHDKLDQGRSIALSSSRLGELMRTADPSNEWGQFRAYGPERTLTDDQHADPVPGFEGPWLAGFAPVGNTPHAVIVQTRSATAVEVPERAILRVLGWCALVLTFGGAVVFVITRLLNARQRTRQM